MVIQTAERATARVEQSLEAGLQELLGPKWSVLGEAKPSLALPQIDLSQVILVSALRSSEEWITGEETIARIMADGPTRLGLGLFLPLLWNPSRIPKVWMQKTNGLPTDIYFDGTTVVGPPKDARYTMCLTYQGDAWVFRAQRIKERRYANHLSAVLPWRLTKFS